MLQFLVQHGLTRVHTAWLEHSEKHIEAAQRRLQADQLITANKLSEKCRLQSRNHCAGKLLIQDLTTACWRQMSIGVIRTSNAPANSVLDQRSQALLVLTSRWVKQGSVAIDDSVNEVSFVNLSSGIY